jgi:hypothetical protein
MLERRSTGASAMPSSTRTGVASCSNRIRPASRTATGAARCSVSHANHSPSSSASSQIVGMPARRWPRPR